MQDIPPAHAEQAAPAMSVLARIEALGGDAAGRSLHPLIQLRWLAVIGQIATIAFVHFGFGIALPLMPMMIVVGSLIAFNLVLTIALGLSMGGHVGGLIGGAMAAFVVLEATIRRQPAIALVGCTILAVGFALLGIWAAQQAVETLQPVISFG